MNTMHVSRRVIGLALGGIGAACAVPATAADYASAWPEGVARIWVGPEHFANRLQDWRIDDGRLECVEARERFPVRTLHLLTRTVSAGRGGLEMTVRTGAIDDAAAPTGRGWSGFLVGAGGPAIDYRLTALTHHRPAEDGGLLAVVDGAGVVAFRDNSGGSAAGGLWSVGGAIEDDDVPVIAPQRRTGDGRGVGQEGSIDLTLRIDSDRARDTLTLTARLARTGAVLSEVVIGRAGASPVEGGVALVSHLGPESSRRGHWFRDWRISGAKLAAHEKREFGPILCTQYTVSGGVLKLTAQMGPLGDRDTRTARLEVQGADGVWRSAAESTIVVDSWTFPFRVEGWDANRERAYRVVYDLVTGPGATRRCAWPGVIRSEPPADRPFVLAAFTGHKIYTGGLKWNHDGIWFPHGELTAAVETHDPDLLFFSGDQIYEGDLTPAEGRPEEKAILDYLYKWYRWCWAFRDLTGAIPAVCIPDDHDVYHGNIWGAGGRKAVAREGLTAHDSGGYKKSPRFVNAVHRTQTSHLPDPVDPAPIEQGITVYHTRLDWGGISFAILADRMFKSAPAVVIPEGKVVNGWFQNPDFDPVTGADVPGAVLLGDRQLEFLNGWSTDFSGGVWMKVALSQTIFANVATLPRGSKSGSVIPGLPILAPGEYPDNYTAAADTDSNGWPQTGRNKALRALRRGFALHVAGDQHLGSTIQYGVDGWRDAGFALCVPSIANTWPRRWFPHEPGANRAPGAPRYTGDFRDGFGNLITVHAVSNPARFGHEPARLHDRAPGYGIVRLDRASRAITIECWPRWADPAAGDDDQYFGWPVTIAQRDNDGRRPAGTLPTIHVPGMAEPVVKVTDETTGEVVYALRIAGSAFTPRVYGPGPFTLGVGEPGTARWRTIEGLTVVGEDGAVVIDVEF